MSLSEIDNERFLTKSFIFRDNGFEKNVRRGYMFTNSGGQTIYSWRGG